MKQYGLTAQATTRVLTWHENSFDKMDQMDKKRISIIEGLAERPNEDLKVVVGNLLTDTFVNFGLEVIETIERQGVLRKPRQIQDGAPQQQHQCKQKATAGQSYIQVYRSKGRCAKITKAPERYG